MNNHSFIVKLGQTGTLVFMLLFSAQGQEINPAIHTGEEINFSIRWVSQFPAARNIKPKKKEKEKNSGVLPPNSYNENKKQHNRNWFTDILFGEKSVTPVKPMSVLALSPDTFWVADQGTGSIIQVNNQVGEITRFRKKYSVDFPSLVGSCFANDGKILFTDSRLNKIFQFVPGNKEVIILNDSLLLDQPTGIAYSAVNEVIWVVETRAHRISLLNKEGLLIKQIGGRGFIPGEFNFPTYIWIDKSGVAYVVDAMNFRIQSFDRDGRLLSVFGEIGDASGYFTRPKGIATDSFGHIYVADALFHAVQVFDPSGKLLYIIGSQGQEKEEFWMPTGIYIDDKDFIYVADSYNSRIQVFRLTAGG